MARVTLGDMNVSIQVMRRDLLPPAPGQSAEPRHAYTPILTTRAAVKSMMGISEFARVDVNGKRATHTFTIRYTTIPIDVRNRIRDARGQLFQVIGVDNVDLQNTMLRIHCSTQGLETVEAAR